MNKLTFLLLSTVLTSCGLKKMNHISKIVLPGLNEKIELGVTTSEVVKKELGNPTKIFATTHSQQEVVYNYEQSGSLKFENNKLMAYFRAPIEDELYLQYWQQRWANKKITKSKLENPGTLHGASDYEMVCKEDGMAIVYNNENGRIKRVIHYAK